MSVASVDKGSIRKPKLILWAAFFVFFYAASLSLATSIRLHQADFKIKYIFLLPAIVWLFWVLLIQRSLEKHLPNRDPLIFPIVALLTGWGLLSVWRLNSSLGFMQTIWFSVACITALLLLRARNVINTLKRYKYIWILLGILLLALTFVVGVNPNEAGPKLWLRFLQVYFQPSEPLKLLVIVYLSAFFADQLRPNSKLLASILPTAVLTLIVAVLLVWQRDLGTALLVSVLYILMITVTTHRRRFLWIFPLVIVIAGVIGYFALPIVRARLDLWLHPWLDTKNAAYQLVQSRIAIAAGGLSGSGPGLGSPYLVPVAISDFIYVVIAEEFGLIGSVFYLSLLLLLIIRGIVTGMRSKTSFGRYLAFGLSSYLALQSIIIISGNLGLIPLTGITLPFTSYGGSSLVSNMAAVAILLKVSTENSAELLPDTTRKPYVLIGSLFMVLFLGLVLRHAQLAIVERESLMARNENPRWAVWDQLSPRGSLLSQTGKPLATVEGEPGEYKLVNHAPNLSHTLGYANGLYGQTGLQSSMYPYLRGLERSDYEKRWLNDLLYNQPPRGLDVKLNISLTLQNRADEALGDANGAVVVLNADSGEIYALASHPGFDSNSLNENWESLMASADAPLLNRSTQSAYPLGTLGHFFLLIQDLQTPVLSGLTPERSRHIDPFCLEAMQSRVTALDQERFGCKLDPRFEPDRQVLEETFALMQQLQLNKAPSIFLETIEASTLPNTAEAYTYQNLEDFKVSPLQMALVAGAITDEGWYSEPRLVNSYLDDDGEWKTFDNLITDFQAVSRDLAIAVQERLSAADETLWYQMGHCKTAEGKPLTWLIGGNTSIWKGSHLALAVLVEDSAPVLVQEIAQQLLGGEPPATPAP